MPRRTTTAAAAGQDFPPAAGIDWISERQFASPMRIDGPRTLDIAPRRHDRRPERQQFARRTGNFAPFQRQLSPAERREQVFGEPICLSLLLFRITGDLSTTTL